MKGRKRDYRFSFASTARVLALLTAMGFAQAALAETVEVAPGIQLTKRTYPAPANEQPFFGFAVKTDAQREADAKFVKALLEAAGSKEKALDEVAKRGWRALAAGKHGEAAMRFNQAFLVAPEQSVVYHGLAVVAQIRFNDLAFAEELLRTARKQPNPLKMLNADYGRVLLVEKRPKEAQPVLEQAVKDAPDFGDAWINLAWARQENGDSAAACAAADEAMKLRPSANAKVDMAKLRAAAQCK
jgi:predicted Zn-dependent protease